MFSLQLGVELLGHLVTLTFEKLPKFFKVVIPFSLAIVCEGSCFSTPFPTVLIVFFIIAILVGVKGYLIVVLIALPCAND